MITFANQSITDHRQAFSNRLKMFSADNSSHSSASVSVSGGAFRCKMRDGQVKNAFVSFKFLEALYIVFCYLRILFGNSVNISIRLEAVSSFNTEDNVEIILNDIITF